MERNENKSFFRRWPAHGWFGIGLITVFWILNWSLPGLRTHWIFFPLWLGYCLAVDALVFLRKGDSMLTRNRRAYAGLFFISVPVWWLFELLNWRTQNWFYEGRQFLSDFQFIVLASVSFSTVIPAVFSTAELVGTFSWLAGIRPGLRFLPTRKKLVGLFVAGWLMLAFVILWPLYFFPFLWLSVFFILEPLNVWVGNRSLVSYVAVGDWRPLFALGLGCLICSFFWEMWNFYSYPKWIYRIPFVGVLHIFEMPLLGYGGYLPFSLELYALYQLTMGFIGKEGKQGFVRIIPEPVMNDLSK
jgi:hypothetical protein